MKIWITNQALAESPVVDGIRESHDVGAPAGLLDLRDPDQVGPHLDGVDAILHSARWWPEGSADEAILDHAARGTYVVAQAAVERGIERLCLVSDLDSFDAYPDGCVIDESWRPMPGTSAAELAPLMAERACREFSRQHHIRCVCLRFGELGTVTPVDMASAAVDKALTAEIEKDRYRWQVYHVSNTTRFPLRAGKGAPLQLGGDAA